MKQHKTKRKRLLVLALCLLTALSMLPVTAMAEDQESLQPNPVNVTIGKVEIVDTIEANGRFTLKVTDSQNNEVDVEALKADGYTITWKKGDKEVKREKVHDKEYNMAEDMSWVNVAYDKGAQATYTVTVSKEETEPESDSRNVDWYDALQNGSFEVPALNYDKNNPNPGGTWFHNGIVQTSQDNVPHWRTTASDKKIELGNVSKVDRFAYENPNYHWFWNPSRYIYKEEVVTMHFYKCDTAKDKEQIAELNCTDTGALYQDVLTTPGAELNWNLSHRGREGVDKMALVIAPLKAVEGKTSQGALEEYIKEQLGAQTIDAPDGFIANDGVFIRTFSDGQEWNTKSGKFKVPENQFLTRFFFVAVSTSTGNLSVGNLLDNVWFSSENIPPADGKGRLEIVKTISGLSKDEATQLIKNDFISYQIGESSDAKNAELSSLEEKETGVFTAMFTTEVDVPANQTVEVTVREDKESAAVTGYNLTIDGDETKKVEIKEGKTGLVTFTNTYISTKPQLIEVPISAKKMLNDGLPNDSGFTFVLKNRDNNEVVQRVNNQGSDITFGSLVFEEAGTYVYTVSEQAGNDPAIQYDDSVYTIEIKITKGENGYSPEISCKKDGENYTGADLVFENYTKPQFEAGTLIVKKTVSGGGADHDKAFTFTVKLKKPPQPDAKAVAPMSDMLNNGDPSIDNQNGSESIPLGDVTFVDNGDAIVGTFTLKHDETKAIFPIPLGVPYTITESDNAGYTVTVNGEEKKSVTGVIEEKETIVTFNNHKDGGYTPGPTYYPLTIQKVVTGLESVPAGYKATVNVMSKYSSVPTRTLMLEPNKPQTVHLPYGEYTLTETAPAVDGYKLTGQTFSENSFMLTYGGKNVTITNTYTKEQEEPVVIPEDPMAPEDDKPDKPSKPKDDTSKVPKTGDDTPLSLALYGLIAAGALLGIRKASKRKVK